jgi:hypothetical protein
MAAAPAAPLPSIMKATRDSRGRPIKGASERTGDVDAYQFQLPQMGTVDLLRVMQFLSRIFRSIHKREANNASLRIL